MRRLPAMRSLPRGETFPRGDVYRNGSHSGVLRILPSQDVDLALRPLAEAGFFRIVIPLFSSSAGHAAPFLRN